MSRWRGLSRKRRAWIAGIALVLATAGLASGQLVSRAIDPAVAAEEETKAEQLAAPMPPPEEVFVQRRTNSDGLGNVLVTTQLSEDALKVKGDEGTSDFITIGNPDAQVILRDDGRGGDAVAGDGVFTGFASVDENDLAAKSSEDSSSLTGRSSTLVPIFSGRSATGTESPVPFDYAGFQAGRSVSIDPAVVFVDGESATTKPSEGVGGVTEASSFGKITAGISSAAPVVPGTNQFQERVLIIRNVGVVTDPTRTVNPCTNAGNANGVWTFKHLMTSMANQAASGIDPSFFAEQWLNHWGANQVINGDNVTARGQMASVINQWRTDSGGGALDLAKAPFRLLAILPRLDLRTTSGGGGAYAVNTSGNFLDAGEARFIFGLVLKPGWSQAGFIGPVQIPGEPVGCRALPMTVIFEFRVPKCHCEDVRAWARQWKELENFVPGTAAYNSRLERLTQQFARANANPTRPNGSALGQLRTNEVALAAPWELREFQLTQNPFTLLRETTVADTPEDAYNNNVNGTGLLREWVVNRVKPNLSGPDFEDPIPPVPLFLTGPLVPGGAPFMGANSLVPEVNPALITHHWKEPTLNVAGDLAENWARHRVSRAACNGCHRREVFTHFVHVDPSNTIPGSNPALPAEISVFLSGINQLGDPATSPNVSDPTQGTPKRNFDDLARRELDIKRLARIKCFRFHPINVAHVQDTLRSTGRLPDNLFEGLTILHEHDRVSVAVEDMKRSLVTEVH